jgi:spermidine synthase
MSLDATWFTEIHQDTAFSLRMTEKLHEEQTPFQKIEIYETRGFGTLMVIDGCVMLTDRDNFIYHEMMSHPVLYTHSDPKNVLIIGGGDCGTLREVLKHPEVERPRRWTSTSGSRAWPRSTSRSCASPTTTRARGCCSTTASSTCRTPRPERRRDHRRQHRPGGSGGGPVLHRLLRQDCIKALGPGGMLVQQSESPLLHTDTIIKPMHDSLRAAGFLDVLALHFPQCTYPSGWWTATMACKDNRHLPARGTGRREILRDPLLQRRHPARRRRLPGVLPQEAVRVKDEEIAAEARRRRENRF